MFPRAREKNNTDSNGGEVVATEKDEGKKKGIFNVESIPLYHCREERNRTTTILIRKAVHVNVYEQDGRFWRK